MSVADAKFILSALDSGDKYHDSAVAWLSQQSQPVLVPVSAIATVSHVLDQSGHTEVEKEFLRELSREQIFSPVSHTQSDYARMAELVETYGRKEFGTSEAGVIAAAERLNDNQIASTRPDLFQAVHPRQVDYFTFPPRDQFEMPTGQDAVWPNQNDSEDRSADAAGPVTVVDTGILVSLANDGDRHHQVSEEWLRNSRGSLLIPGPVVGEAGFQIRGLSSRAQEVLFLHELGSSDTFKVINPEAEDYARMAELLSAHPEFKLGAVDASVISLAEKSNAQAVATVDSRDFGKIRQAIGATWDLPIQGAEQQSAKGKSSMPGMLAKSQKRSSKGNAKAKSGPAPGRENPFNSRVAAAVRAEQAAKGSGSRRRR
ncbi:hypothetical protein GCM10009799_23340 [Nocardiopsis rhodophaea]|uniref:Ribonuclease VapC n=1 Tax=Nocardiopsis rhodophaea TaxID=280238 RepID=A0ABN2T0L7_9ACTN